MAKVEISNPAKSRVSREFMRSVVEKSLSRMGSGEGAEISVALVSSGEIRKMNRKYRKIDKPTDVLSFKGGDFRIPSSGGGFLGEIVICYPQAKRQAQERNHSIREEIRVLLVHGLLHLLGYDHEKEGEAERMERLEEKLLVSE